MKLLFYLSLIFLFYTYCGYILFMSILARLRKDKAVDKQPITPLISVVIAAYNEEKNIGGKLNDIINLDYPREKMEVFVVSDASSDATDEIVSGFAGRGVKLLRLEKRSGKIAAYRKALPQIKGEIVVFSDATSVLTHNSLANLVSNFNDKSVGCVGGLLTYINPKRALVGKGENKYWQYEKRVIELESRLASLTSVSGTLYAVRKELYPLDIKDYLADDLIVPFNVVKKGYRVILEPQAVCYDYTTLSINEEMAKRIRITVQNIRGLIDQPGILNPFKYGLYSFLVISHKLFRLLVPFFMAALLISNIFLLFHSSLFAFLLVLQIIFYLANFYGYAISERYKFSTGKYLFYFGLSNYAILMGIIQCIRGQKVVTWETIRA
ncbi:MAG: glycosyltransferase family 2 protein [Candidatus Omnitrophota bacterium]|nr:glycosyltransferase family 2 protein [Candidatus Omnitrophota bacterium]